VLADALDWLLHLKSAQLELNGLDWFSSSDQVSAVRADGLDWLSSSDSVSLQIKSAQRELIAWVDFFISSQHSRLYEVLETNNDHLYYSKHV
jgi:hypothetical protein